LSYRCPGGIAGDYLDFYNMGYHEPGDLATELPDDKQLGELLETGFRGTGKDFTYHLSILRALKVPENGTILDFGSSWGYASWQFARAGFSVKSFEISRPRAEHTDINEVGQGFDVVYSCHVLEHIPNPRDVLLKQLSLVKPGGIVAAHTPNGGRDFQSGNYPGFHRVWGRVHPVLLSDRFVQNVAGSRPYICTSDDRPENLATWDRISQVKQPTRESGFFFAIRAMV
jgi:hypothetical protein